MNYHTMISFQYVFVGVRCYMELNWLGIDRLAIIIFHEKAGVYL